MSARQTEEQRILAKLEAEQEQHQARLQQRNTRTIELVKRDVILALKGEEWWSSIDIVMVVIIPALKREEWYLTLTQLWGSLSLVEW